MREFSEAVAGLLELGADRGANGAPLFVFRKDVIDVARTVYIRWPLPDDNGRKMEALYDLLRTTRKAFAFDVFCMIGDQPCCYIDIPTDEDDAERMLLPASDVKLRFPVKPRQAVPVRSSLRWWWLGWRRRRQQAEGWDDRIVDADIRLYDEPPLAGETALDFVNAAIDRNLLFKQAADALDKLEPSEEAAKRLIAAYENDDAPGWLVAFLLGQNGHPCGYATVKSILEAHLGQGASSYAGVAMVRLIGREAINDLRKLLRTADHPRVRRGSAYGLAELQDEKLIDDFVAALREDGLPRHDAAAHVAHSGASDELLLSWLDGEDPLLRGLACHVVAVLDKQKWRRRPGAQVLERARDCANRDGADIDKYTKDALLGADGGSAKQ